jgi:hypothetical protein
MPKYVVESTNYGSQNLEVKSYVTLYVLTHFGHFQASVH